MADENYELVVLRNNTSTIKDYKVSIDNELVFGSDIHRKLVRELRSIVSNTSSTDVVSLYVNSIGGSAYVMSEIIHLFRGCVAKLRIYVAGTAMSAAALLVVSLTDDAEYVEICEESTVMFHSASSLYGGKPDGLMGYVEGFKVINRIMVKKLKKVLTKKEYRKVTKHEKELWLNGKQLFKRLKAAYPDKEIHLVEF